MIIKGFVRLLPPADHYSMNVLTHACADGSSVRVLEIGRKASGRCFHHPRLTLSIN